MFRLTVTFLLLISTMALSAQNTLTPELLWNIRRVSGPTISPDGKLVVYGVKVNDIAQNKGNTNLYIMNADGSGVNQLTNFKGSEFNVTWRPDGKKIGFLSAESGSVQVWEVNTDGTQPRQITKIEEGINGFSYSPKGDKIAFIKEVKIDKTAKDIYPDLPLATARIYDELMMRHWDSWNEGTYSHVFLMDYENGSVSGAPKDINEGERFDTPMKPFGGMEQIAWNHNGSSIAYTCKKLVGKDYAVSTNSDIYVYNLNSGKTENLTQGMMGYDMEPTFSPDGKSLAWLSMAKPGFEADKSRIMVLDLASKRLRNYSETFDQSAGSLSWPSDSKALYFTSGINATYQLFKLDFSTKKFNQLTEGIHNIVSYGLTTDGMIYGKQSMSSPTELFKASPDGKNETQITSANKDVLSNTKMGKVEKRMMLTTDRKEMLTWVIYPPNFDPTKKYPTLLYCQGGPQSAVSQFFSYRWNFQIMAAHGYIIVAPNRRGLPSFGQDWNDEISGDWGGQAIQDYLTAIDEMAKEPYVDADRLGAVGASYGGYSVYFLAGVHEGRFKTFISHCGLFNLESWYASTEESFFADHDMKGPYWKTPQPKSYEKFSPHKFVKNWDTPILVIHNQKDFRVPLGEGLQAYGAAQLQGLKSRFLYFPDEGHWVLQAQNGILWQRVFFDWLKETL
ncbi:MAG: dipeptidyl aminopeptidase/acylaminoacyl peptidase [Sphingobacteriales bacterium]|jgi:dipeptidyl aminopeptidase/acylaminoacyl peptidase